MKIGIQLILTACVVYFGLTYVQPHSQSYENSLEAEVLDEQIAFDAMKEELELARHKKTFKKRTKNIVARKRETEVTKWVKGPGASERVYNQYIKRVEKSFLEYHPNPHKIIWRKVDNLTAEEHRVGCLAALATMSKLAMNYIWNGVPTEEIQSRRILRDAPLHLQTRNETAKVKLLKCFYNETQFYVINGDEKNMFTVWFDHLAFRTPTFRLRAGPHELYWSGSY